MSALAVISSPMTETRGQTARRRRATLRVSRERVAHEAGVSVKTIKSYEDDARENMPSGDLIEAALERLEQSEGTPSRRRRTSDTAQHRVIEAALDGAEGEVMVRIFDDGTRAIFLVPRGGHLPDDESIQETLRQARGTDHL